MIGSGLHIFLVVVATIFGYVSYLGIQNKRMKSYFEANAMSREDRYKLQSDETHEQMELAFRLVIWCLCAVFSLAGNLLGAILTTIFTVEGVWHIFKEAWGACKTRVSALTSLFIPFGALIMAYSMKGLGIIPGILIGVFVTVIPTIIYWFNRNRTAE